MTVAQQTLQPLIT